MCPLMTSFSIESRHEDGPEGGLGAVVKCTRGGRKLVKVNSPACASGNTHTAEAGRCMDLDKEAHGGRWADDGKRGFQAV